MVSDGSRTPGSEASESTDARTELWLDMDFAVEFMMQEDNEEIGEWRRVTDRPSACWLLEG